METLRPVALWVLICTPVLGLLLACLSKRVVRTLVGIRVLAAAMLLSALGLLCDVASSGAPIEQSLGTWLSLVALQRPLTISFGVRCDTLALLQVAWTSAVLFIVLARWPNHISLRWLMLAWVGVTDVATAGNLGQMFWGWCLSAWASSELARQHNANSETSPAFRPVWLVQRVSDVMLLCGIGLIWLHFGSLEWSAWTTEAIARQASDLLGSVALCVLIGVIGRCAQLPLSVWLETETGFAAKSNRSVVKLSDEMVGLWNVPDGHYVADRLKADPAGRWHNGDDEAISASVMAWWLCAAFLPVGICVLLRFEPLLAAASNTKLLAVAVGAFTLMLCSASAAAQNSWARVLGQLAVGQCGLALLTLCLEQSDGTDVAMFMLLWQSLLFALLLTASAPSERRSSSGLLVVTALLLISGLFGRHAVVDVIWEKAFPAVVAEASTTHGLDQIGDVNDDSIVLGTTSSGLLPIVVGMVCLSELLLSFSLFRAIYLSRRLQSASRMQASSDPFLWLVLMTFAAIGVWLGSDAESWSKILGAVGTATNSAQANSHRMALGFGHLMPLSAIGLVLAWWMYAKPSALPEKVSSWMGPFARLSRNRFYWNDLYFLLVSQPGISFGGWVAWLDEQIWERARQFVRRSFARFAGERYEPLANGSWSVYALTTFSSAVVLAWMLMWLKSSS